ncbi:MAG TPA: hypothetical protein PLH11_07170 [Gemmobacter sp.]|nr:hypothetical protein [Gemmobacter sp.]
MTPQEAVQAKNIAELIAAAIPAQYADWATISAWLWLSPDGKGGGGGAQAYDAYGNAVGFSFAIPPVLPALRILREMHPDADHRAWKTVLLQFGRKSDQLCATYKYGDALRWMVTKDNFQDKIHEMRPDFSLIPRPNLAWSPVVF